MAIICFAFSSFGQTAKLDLPPLSISKTNTIKQPYFSIGTHSLVTVSHSFGQRPQAFGNYVHYPAIFCQMEQKSVNRLGVMIQVHAGDYNSYSRRR